MFVIYINDLPGISNLAEFILYADDANIIVSGSTLDEVSHKVNKLIGSLVDWVGVNGLSLNSSCQKTCYMIFSRSRLNLDEFTVSIDNTDSSYTTENRC